MKIIEAIRIAMRALAANKLRSILTMLGIIIGVGAVITLMSVGRGVEKYVTDQFASAGTNLLFIVPGQLTGGPPTRNSNTTGTLTLSDAEAIGNPFQVPDVAAVAPEVSGSTTVSRGKKSFRASVSGVTPSYQEVRSWNPILGDFLATTDIQERGRVAVIGLEAYRRLFEPDEYPIDQTIRINNLVFRVIGVLEERGGQRLRESGRDYLDPPYHGPRSPFPAQNNQRRLSSKCDLRLGDRCRSHARSARADRRSVARAPRHQLFG